MPRTTRDLPRSSGLMAIRSLGVAQLSEADEFIVVLDGGALFFTGGFESIESLEQAITKGAEIAGSYASCVDGWIITRLDRSHVIAVSDLRGTTEQP